jgi:hypothetical protein
LKKELKRQIEKFMNNNGTSVDYFLKLGKMWDKSWNG